MSEPNFIYDPEFIRLQPILAPKKYAQLEEHILSDGRCDPIVVWDNILVDGKYRYEICYRHKLPIEVRELDYVNREEAICWVCQCYLSQKDIPNEFFRYLVGKMYIAEKALGEHRSQEQFHESDGTTEQPAQWPIHGRGSALPIGRKYGISCMAIYGYKNIANAIDEIAEKDSRLAEMYLSGRLHIKKDNLATIASMNEWQIRALTNAMIRQNKKSCHTSDMLSAISEPDLQKKQQTARERRKAAANVNQPSVKDVPTYDPDGEVASLSLTIPSWNSSIDRVFTKTDMHKISDKAKTQLREELLALRDSIDLVLLAIEEVSDGG